MAKHKLDELLAGRVAREQKAQKPPAARATRVDDNSDRDTIFISRDHLEPNPFQPRRIFRQDELFSLGESLRRDGQLQAIVARPHPAKPNRYQIASGERRWRAAAQQYGDVEKLRVTVRELDDEQMARIGLIENVQRADLSPIERARGLQQLRNFPPGGKAKTLTALESEVGIRRSQIERLLSLLKLPEAIQERIEELQLNEKHGRALLMLSDDAGAQKNLLRSIEQGEMSGNEALRLAEAWCDAQSTSGDDGTNESTSGANISASTLGASTSSGVSRETGKGPASTSGASTSSASTSSSRPDPLANTLKPLVSFAAEGARVFEGLSVSREYKRNCLREIERARQFLDKIEGLLRD